MQSEKDDEYFSRRDYDRASGIQSTTQKTRKTTTMLSTKKGKPPLIGKNTQQASTTLKNSRLDNQQKLAYQGTVELPSTGFTGQLDMIFAKQRTQHKVKRAGSTSSQKLNRQETNSDNSLGR